MTMLVFCFLFTSEFVYEHLMSFFSFIKKVDTAIIPVFFWFTFVIISFVGVEFSFLILNWVFKITIAIDF